MVETIAPVVHGGRNRRYWSALALHVLGATISGALFGALLALVGSVLGAPWGTGGLVAIVVVSSLYAARELFGAPVPLPDLDRQVPDWWRTFYSPNVAALLYGLGLGVGFFTFLTFGTYAAVATGALVSGDALTGAVLLGAFGFIRSVAVVIGAFPHGEHEPETWPSEVADCLGEPTTRRAAGLVNAALLVAVAATAIVQAM
jgi:hypothetical protein